MAENSRIEWTDHTFNSWIGCQKVSPGCDHCYAEAMMDTRLGRVEWGPHGQRVRTAGRGTNCRRGFMPDQLALFDVPLSQAPRPRDQKACNDGAGPAEYLPCPDCGAQPAFLWIGPLPCLWTWRCSGCGATSCGGLSEDQARNGWNTWAGGSQ